MRSQQPKFRVTMRYTALMRRLIAIAAAAVVMAASPAWAIGVLGKVTVKVDGFQGWHQVRDADLEFRFNGIPGNTIKGGAFRIEDLGVLGRGLIPGSKVTFADEQANFVRVLVGRTRITLPIVWTGFAYDDYFVAEPVFCEVLANGTGACTPEAHGPEYTNRIRLMVGLPAIESAPARSPNVVAPAPVQPKQPFVEVSPEQVRPETGPPSSRAPEVVQPQPKQPPPEKPPATPTATPQFDLDVVEPID